MTNNEGMKHYINIAPELELGSWRKWLPQCWSARLQAYAFLKHRKVEEMEFYFIYY